MNKHAILTRHNNRLKASLTTGISLCCALALQSQSAFALDYPIDVQAETGDLVINIDTGQSGQQAMVYLDNLDTVAAACIVIFKNGPELPIERRLSVAAQSRQVVSATLQRGVVRLKVSVNCTAPEAE